MSDNQETNRAGSASGNRESGSKRTYAQLFTPGRAPRKMLPEKQRRYHHSLAVKKVSETGTQSYGSTSDAQTQTDDRTIKTTTASTQTKTRSSLSRGCKSGSSHQ